MKRLAIVIALLVLIPQIASATKNEPGPTVTSSTPRQFVQTAVLPSAGGAELTIVSTAGNEGQAKKAMSQAFGYASTKAGMLMAEVNKVNAQPRKARSRRRATESISTSNRLKASFRNSNGDGERRHRMRCARTSSAT